MSEFTVKIQNMNNTIVSRIVDFDERMEDFESKTANLALKSKQLIASIDARDYWGIYALMFLACDARL